MRFSFGRGNGGASNVPFIAVHSTRAAAASEDLERSKKTIRTEGTKETLSDGSDSTNGNTGILEHIPNLWTPFFLGKAFLACFGAILVGSAVALAALFVVSKKNRGLKSYSGEDGKEVHFGWTYGPTAVLTLFAAFWGQTEFRTRQLWPWKVLADGPAPAKETLLLDYITPMSVVVIWKSVRASHYPVALATLGSLLFKLLVVLSTGLFMLQDISIQQKTVLEASNKFSGATFQNSSMDGRPFGVVLANQKYGNKYPFGADEQYSYQTFNSSLYRPDGNQTMTATVDAFQGKLTCEILINNYTVLLPTKTKQIFQNGTYQVDPSKQVMVTTEGITVKTPNCEMFLYLPDIGGAAHMFQPNWSTWLANCQGLPPNDLSGRVRQNAHNPINSKFVLRSLVRSPNFNFKRDRNDNSAHFTIVSCDPSYSIQPIDLTIKSGLNSFASHLLSISTHSVKRKLENVSDLDILNRVQGAIIEGPGNELSQFQPTIKRAAWFSMLNVSNPQPWNATWLDGQTLKTAAEQSFPPIAAQVARFHLLDSSSDQLDGIITTTETRLLIRFLSFVLMQVVLLLLVTIDLALFMLAPRSLSATDPSNLGTFAALLASDDQLDDSFRSTSSWDLNTLARMMADKRYRTELNGSQSKGTLRLISITESCADGGDENTVMGGFGKVVWWRPFSSTVAVQILVIGFSSALVIALEVIYRKSKKLNGIAAIGSNEYVRYTWLYIPALSMFAIGALYGLIDFGARLFEPYSLLRRKAVPGWRLRPQIGKFAFLSLWESIKYGQVATAATTIALMLAVFLPITVSGLYSVSSFVEQFPALAHREDNFNFSLATYGSFSSTGGAILGANLSYPLWTYGDLVFPSLGFPKHNKSNHTRETLSPSTASVKLPVLRARTNCTVVGNDKMLSYKVPKAEADMGSNGRYNTEKNYVPGVGINVTLPEHCWNSKTGDKVASWTVPFGYFGFLGNPTASTLDQDCAHSILLYGFVDMRDPEKVQGNVLLCNPYFETVDTRFTISLPGMTIDERELPVVDENSTSHAASYKTISELVKTSDTSYWWFEDLPMINITKSKYETHLDRISSIMVHGMGGTPAPELLNAEKLQAAFQHTFGIIEAQRANCEFRQSISDPSIAPITYNGTITSLHLRLVQDSASTRILQALLGFMLLCAIVAFFAIDTKRTLTKSPTTIAAILSMLAGSGIREIDLERREPPHQCDQKLGREEKIPEERLFRLKWWHEQDDEGGVAKKRFGIGMTNNED